MSDDEIDTRIKFLEKATNRLAEEALKKNRGHARGPHVVDPPEVIIPRGGIRLKLPAYDVSIKGILRRVDVATLESDPELYAYVRTKYPGIFVD